MWFDYLKDIRMPNDKERVFGASKILYDKCCGAEKNARINPDACMINIRQALEVLVKGLLIEEGQTYFSNQISLSNMIDMYQKRCRFIRNKNVSKLHDLRIKANSIVHISYNIQGEKQYSVKDVHATTKDSCRYTIELYNVIAEIFEVRVQKIAASDLPFGEYQIVSKIKAGEYESVEGKYNYVAKQENSNIATYVYVRPFSRKENSARKVFDERDMEVQNFFKNMRGSNYIIRAHELQTEENCEIRYLAYEIQENTKTLDQLIDKLNAKEALSIIAQIAQGLAGLASPRINIHHRGIRPNCIFVSKFDDGYEAKLGCFETAKIEYKEKAVETVGVWMAKAQQGSIFVYPKLLELKNVTSEQWEAGDVYSLAVILLYCLDYKSIKEGIIDYSVIAEYFSEEFYMNMMNILGSDSFEMIPSMKEFYNSLKKELENGED